MAKNFKEETVIMERSIYTDKQIFASNCYEHGVYSDLEWVIYDKWHEWIVSLVNPTLDGIIYLRTSPETCLRRLKPRGRNEEKQVPLEFLKELHYQHENWLIPSGTKPNGPITT